MVNVIVESTPNPATLKFLPGCSVMETGTANFASPEKADKAPLVRQLFKIDGVAGVFLGADFISVAKRSTSDWQLLEPVVTETISVFFQWGGPAVTVEKNDGEGAGSDEDDDETVLQIKELLDTRIRPSVAMDGGDIVYRGFERGVVFLSLQGACIGCPSSNATLKMGVENLLKHYVPDVLRVEAVN
ncbi:MAG: NifU family protein [Alphaproteobacteria bacterium]|nr:NifU family protein [Alphaproteobacteria bacterium]